jgi:hypothetical protein
MMTYSKILKMQKDHGLTEMQEMIFSGQCWKMEGSVGRAAMSHLNQVSCMLGLKVRHDYYGNRIPSRKEVKAGSKGSYELCRKFWERVDSGDLDLYGTGLEDY